MHNHPADMADAHSFTWHGTGQSLLEAKLRAVDAARSSVCMETFTFRDSDVGLRFRSALAAAARGRRIVMALAGGILAGFASRVASGCTSGQS